MKKSTKKVATVAAIVVASVLTGWFLLPKVIGPPPSTLAIKDSLLAGFGGYDYPHPVAVKSSAKGYF